jgi:hypothetical protein
MSIDLHKLQFCTLSMTMTVHELYHAHEQATHTTKQKNELLEHIMTLLKQT